MERKTDMTQVIQTRVTPAQKDVLNDAAAGVGLSLAAWVRSVLIREARKGGDA